MPVTLVDHAGLSAVERAELETAHGTLSSLSAVLDWGRSQRPQLGVEDILTQDEYTHDVLVPWRDGRYLVYDTT